MKSDIFEARDPGRINNLSMSAHPAKVSQLSSLAASP